MTVVAKLAADFPLGESFSAITAGALCVIPEAMTTPTRESATDMVKRADAPGTQRASQPHSSLDLNLITGPTIIVPLVSASCGVMGQRLTRNGVDVAV